MNENRIAAFFQRPSHSTSRRDVLWGIAGAGLGLGALRLPGVAAAESRHRQHKHKRHQKHGPKQLPPATHTVRQSVTQTFSSTGRIAIPDDPEISAKFATSGKAKPYPSTIEVSGYTNGVITDVNLTVTGLAHTAPADIDVLLSKNDGRQALVMSDAGFGFDIVGIDLTLDDEAAAALPQDETLRTGTFRPMDFDTVPGDGASPDDFSDPAPALNGNVALSAFDGADPNGTWQLWVMDNATSDRGEIAGGWSIEITAEVDVPVQDPAPLPHRGKKHHRRNRDAAPIAAGGSRRR
jgi:hypothetical protein